MSKARREMTPRFAKRAARMNALAKRLGLQPLDGERVRGSFEARERRRAEARRQSGRYAGCQSVTAAARDLGMRRDDLFAWLEREGWLYRTTDGWRAVDDALAAGFVVMRGPASIAWPQVTQAGIEEIARRHGIATDGAP